jgi:DNA recombination protein RmuC
VNPLGLVVIGFLTLAVVYLIYRNQHLLVRCTIAEEKVKIQEQLKETFQFLSAEVLDKTNRTFLELAKDDLGHKHQAMAEMMGKLEKGISQIENERKLEHGALRQQLYALLETEQQLRKETTNLVKALRSPNTRGRWGEFQLKRVVELAGMLSHCDFYEQIQEVVGDFRFRPDLIIRLPGDRQVVIDAKVSLEAYLEAIETMDGPLRELKFKEHAKQIRSHITALGKKSYWEHFHPTPEFVVLFLPSETMFSAALEYDPSLIEMGVNEGVILATPTTLIALLRAVSYGWKQESLSLHAEKVRELGHELYKRVVDMGQHWSRMGRSLGGAVDAYNKATGTLESRVFVTARKFKDLGAAAEALDLPESEVIDSIPRDLSLTIDEGNSKIDETITGKNLTAP